MKKITIGARGSKLSLAYATKVKRLSSISLQNKFFPPISDNFLS